MREKGKRYFLFREKRQNSEAFRSDLSRRFSTKKDHRSLNINKLNFPYFPRNIVFCSEIEIIETCNTLPFAANFFFISKNVYHTFYIVCMSWTVPLSLSLSLSHYYFKVPIILKHCNNNDNGVHVHVNKLRVED